MASSSRQPATAKPGHNGEVRTGEADMGSDMVHSVYNMEESQRGGMDEINTFYKAKQVKFKASKAKIQMQAGL